MTPYYDDGNWPNVTLPLFNEAVNGQESVAPLDSRTAAGLVVEHHYLHRRPSISHSFGLWSAGEIVGCVTLGTPPSRHAQQSVCPTNPSLAIELNRLWVADAMPRNTESWFVSRALRMLPPLLVFSYADTRYEHYGYIYRALNFRYAGWTDMDRKTPRFDYIPWKEGAHTREAFRTGYAKKVRRQPKVKYWLPTGNRTERHKLAALCGWPALDWHALRVPGEPTLNAEEAAWVREVGAA